MKSTMSPLLRIVAVVLSICAVSFNVKSAEVETNIFGIWKITAILDSADISGLSDLQAKKLVGMPVIIAPDHFEFNGMTCKSPTYQRTVEDTAVHLREKGHVSSVNLHLPNPVTVIDAKCTFIYLKRKDRIVVQWDGVYFDAVKQRK
jgi:hypothetical protein